MLPRAPGNRGALFSPAGAAAFRRRRAVRRPRIQPLLHGLGSRVCLRYGQIMIETALRPATLADIPAITAIYAHAVKHGTATFEIEPPGEAEMADRFRALADGGFPYLVAERVGAVRGYAYAGAYRTRIAYRYTVENSVYIAPDCHRQGIGRALLDELVSEASVRGFRQMIAVIGDSAQAASIALHRAAGFEMVGTFAAVGFKFGRWLDTVLMQRPLGSGAATLP
jgi:phosphinothricin acetyltransferase